MLFNTLEFLLFFPTVVLLYFITPFKKRWLVLLIVSYYFYMSWKVEYALLLVISTLVDFYCGKQMAKYVERKRRKPFLYLSILTNLGILFTFKYFNFFTEAISDTGNLLGIEVYSPVHNLILPIGISFYTFQTMSYSIDIYYGRIKPETRLGIFALFVTFFPQLVAGPIERAGNLLSQFKQKHYFNYDRVTAGLKLMAWGMFKKVVIADNLALLVNPVYNNPSDYEGISLIIATIFFAFQIFCDFSGYSDIAIGAARVMGFKLMENFRRPYHAKSIAEFWSRWHISLSTWFRDYVYIPLGGNRVIKWRWYYNLFITFLVSGLWHGANWTFVVWGALHGFYLIFAIITEKSRNRISQYLGLNNYPRLNKWLQSITVFILVCFSWIFFRATNISEAFYIIHHSVTGIGNIADIFSGQYAHVLLLDQGKNIFIVSVMGIMVMEMVHWLQRKGSVTQMLSLKPVWFRWSMYYIYILAVLLFGEFGQEEFIYFQF